MKAYVLHDINDLRYEDVAIPPLMDNDVLIEIHAAGVCGSDIPRIFQTGSYYYPLIVGHEFSGKVVDVGRYADRSWMGKRVCIFPLIPCRKCIPCREGHYELCREYSYLGSRRNGGFAEYVAVPQWNLLELPDIVTYGQAAIMEPMAVAVHAMRHALLKSLIPSAKVAVCGLGAIGIWLTMFLKEADISNVFVVGNKDIQHKAAIELGLPDKDFCDSRSMSPHEWLMDRTDGQGVDVYFECVGKNETISEGIDSVAPGGVVQLVGNPVSNIILEKNIYWKILRNQLTVQGSWNSSFTHDADDDWHYVLDRLRNGKICPEKYITHRFDFEELLSGLEVMRDKKEEYIKIIVEKQELLL
ncbi:MAG: galactitol-1-phosphate 5-dehydrogenase [bacterium]|nr:galactitol-1-phosphate 5-dehydrogenase [bacterium]MCM1374649.1 galactitol-1-phosphate 5-dehydrogenase [Muribaculum sp.]